MRMKSDITCDYLIVCCMDFRIQQAIRSWVGQHLQDKQYDYVGFAGSTKELEIILSQIEIAYNLHRVKKVILIHHEDCMAYGAQGSFDKHAADLRKARERILERHPDLTIAAFYLKLSGEFLPIF